MTTRRGRGDTATITKQGELEISGVTYRSLSAAAKAVSGNVAEPGWSFWAVTREGAATPLYVIRRNFLGLVTDPKDGGQTE